MNRPLIEVIVNAERILREVLTFRSGSKHQKEGLTESVADESDTIQGLQQPKFWFREVHQGDVSINQHKTIQKENTTQCK